MGSSENSTEHKQFTKPITYIIVVGNDRSAISLVVEHFDPEKNGIKVNLVSKEAARQLE